MGGTHETLDVEAFRVRAKQAGLVLEEREIALMYEGYLGLQTLLARLPDRPDLSGEPATVFMVPGARIGR